MISYIVEGRYMNSGPHNRKGIFKTTIVGPIDVCAHTVNQMNDTYKYSDVIFYFRETVYGELKWGTNELSGINF